MEVHLNPEKEARLSQIATQRGLNADQLAEQVLNRYVDDETRFLEGVERGIAAAERGEFIEEEEMDARFEQMMKS